jgi:hypothetical protein
VEGRRSLTEKLFSFRNIVNSLAIGFASKLEQYFHNFLYIKLQSNVKRRVALKERKDEHCGERETKRRRKPGFTHTSLPRGWKRNLIHQNLISSQSISHKNQKISAHLSQIHIRLSTFQNFSHVLWFIVATSKIQKRILLRSWDESLSCDSNQRKGDTHYLILEEQAETLR